MAPFKRPRTSSITAGGAAATTDFSAAPQSPSHHSKGSSSSKHSTSHSAASDSTYSTIQAPDLAGQNRLLLEGPKMTQALKVPKRFRKEQSREEDVGWVLREVFLKTDYKGRQEDIMKASLQGSDILVIAPTGMGKSLCFQVPAVAERHGLTLVVSPLLSLMQDQITALRKLEVPCAMLSSKTSPEEQKEIFSDMESGHPKNRLLYITPERLSSPPFRKKLAKLHKQQELNRLVVDEAHCISEWGHDFRPEYAKLGNFRAEFLKVPIMALTASATPKVQDDIVNELSLDLDLLFKVIHPFNRPNLFYEVRYLSESNDGPHHRQDDILTFITRTAARGGGRPAAGIIYCRAKKTCDELALWLRGKGVFAAPYHRGLKDVEADENQRRWVENDQLAEEGKARVDCIVATIAFGMGIDKSNCRYVIHYDVPKSFEGYYQETGRAGRDGHTARCIMYYSAEDKLRIKELVRKSHSSRERRADRDGGVVPSQRAPESIDALLNFAEDVKTCRHVLICRYFGEQVTQADAAAYCVRLCDVCRDPKKARSRRDEGLVELDFMATQAVSQYVDEYDVDPDDFYETGRREEPEESDEEDEQEEQPQRKCRGGFRSAAVERNRAEEKLSRVEEEEGYSSSLPEAEVEFSVPLKGSGGDEEDEVEIVNEGAQEKSKSTATIEAMELSDEEDELEVQEEQLDDLPSPAQPSRPDKKRPRKPLYEDLAVASDLEDEEEDLPDPRALANKLARPLPAKENRPPVKGVHSGSVPIVEVAQKLPLLGAIGQKQLGNFTTPFADPARHPNYKPNHSLKQGNEDASSTGDDPPSKFDVVPSNYEKAIPVTMRTEAVVHFVKYLQRGLLSKHGVRSSASEEKVWKELGAKAADHELRRKIVLSTAIELESDLFWTCTTTAGYRQFLNPPSRAVKAFAARDGGLPTSASADVEGVDEVVKALKRAVVSTVPKKRAAKRKVVSDEED